MEKLKKTAAVTLNFLKIIKIFIIAMTVLAVMFTGIALFVPGAETLTGLHLGRLNLKLAPESGLKVPVSYTILLLAAAVLSALLGLAVLKQLQNIFTPMSKGQPFHKTAAPSIRKIAWLTLIAGALIQLLHIIADTFIFSRLNLSELLSSRTVLQVSLKCVFNCNFLIGFGILFLLSHVFEYGQELQQLSDETL